MISTRGIEVGQIGLCEDEGFEQSLFAGDEEMEERVSAAFAFGPQAREFRGRQASKGRAGSECVQHRIDGPVEQVDEGVGVGEGRVHPLRAQQMFPAFANLGALRAQGLNEGILHGAS